MKSVSLDLKTGVSLPRGKRTVVLFFRNPVLKTIVDRQSNQNVSMLTCLASENKRDRKSSFSLPRCVSSLEFL